MIKRCTENDVSTLQEISIQTFSETFEHDNEEQHLQAYLEKAYNIEKLCEELSNIHSFFYFIKYLSYNFTFIANNNFIHNTCALARLRVYFN